MTIDELTKARIAKKSDAESAMLWLNIIRAHLTRFTKEDEGAMGVPAYILSYKGKRKNRAFQGLIYCKVDIGSVGKRLMDVYVRERMFAKGCPTDPENPLRLDREGDAIYKVV